MKIYTPEGPRGEAATRLALFDGRLADCRIMALDNGKPGAATLLRRTGEILSQRTGAQFEGMQQKGSAATPCEEDTLRALMESADIILTGSAD